MVDKRQLINAVIGAIASFVLSFIPFSTVVGGAIGGYLQGPNRREGLTVGALAGLLAALPFAAFGFLFVVITGFGAFGEGGGVAFGFFFLFLLVALFFLLLYTVGLCALGGYIGSYLATEYPDKRRDVLETIGMEEDRPGASTTGVHEP